MNEPMLAILKLGVGLDTQTATPSECGSRDTKIAPPPQAEVARRFPQLEILECLGQGGMGVVYKARQPKLDRLVALKILAPEKAAEPKFAERFEREAQALARLSHPHIVTVHDYGEVEGMFYLLMEYVDGSTLRQLLRAGRLKPEVALAIVPSICDSLQFAHQQGVVHRDIKPENVLLDPQGRVKIADFGIAKLMHVNAARPALTEERSVIGTPHYMAPEQVEHPQLVDHRADIYSLGVVFYEMLTGELPLGKFQPPSRKVQMDVRLDDVVLHALEKEPTRRYQHASEVKTDLETIRSSAKPIRRAETLGRCRIPGTNLALVEWRDGQSRIDWNHVALAWMLLMMVGGAALGLVALGAHLTDVYIPPGAFEKAAFGLAFATAILLTVVVRRARLSPADGFVPPRSRPGTDDGTVAKPEAITQARRLVKWPATGLTAIGVCPLVVAGLLFGFGHWPQDWQGLIALFSLSVIGYVILLGSHRMRNLQNYGVAIVAAITGLIVSFPALPLAVFPIWALMVLYRPDVRAAFADGQPARSPVSAAAATDLAGGAGAASRKSFPYGERLSMLALILLIVLLIAALPPTVTYLSIMVLNRLRDPTPAPAADVVRTERQLAHEIARAVNELGWKADFAVTVSPGLDHAECRVAKIQRTRPMDGPTRHPALPPAIHIEGRGNQLWLVRGEGAFQSLRLEIDTSRGPGSPDAGSPDALAAPQRIELERILHAYAERVWIELAPRLESSRLEDAPEIAADIAKQVAQKIVWPHRELIQRHILEQLPAGDPLDPAQWTTAFNLTNFKCDLVFAVPKEQLVRHRGTVESGRSTPSQSSGARNLASLAEDGRWCSGLRGSRANGSDR